MSVATAVATAAASVNDSAANNLIIRLLCPDNTELDP